MFVIGTQEIILIVLVVLLFFGGKKIPELMTGHEKGVRSFFLSVIRYTIPGRICRFLFACKIIVIIQDIRAVLYYKGQPFGNQFIVNTNTYKSYQSENYYFLFRCY